MLYYPVGAAIGACEGGGKAMYEAVTALPPVLFKDPTLLVKVGLGLADAEECPVDACPWSQDSTCLRLGLRAGWLRS